MESFESAAAESSFGAQSATHHLTVIDPVVRPRVEVAGLVEMRLDDLETLLISKTTPGFTRDSVQRVRELVRDAAAGRLGRLKFVVFDFNHPGESNVGADGAFAALISEAANLILRAPVVLVANARAAMAGDDLEFALACSMLIGEANASFSFAADPIVSMETYGFLAQKIGFVRAERLMEAGERLDAQQMHDLLLLKDIAPQGAGLESVRTFLARTSRRHNSCYGIYRAHRLASTARAEAFRAIA